MGLWPPRISPTFLRPPGRRAGDAASELPRCREKAGRPGESGAVSAHLGKGSWSRERLSWRGCPGQAPMAGTYSSTLKTLEDLTLDSGMGPGLVPLAQPLVLQVQLAGAQLFGAATPRGGLVVLPGSMNSRQQLGHGEHGAARGPRSGRPLRAARACPELEWSSLDRGRRGRVPARRWRPATALFSPRRSGAWRLLRRALIRVVREAQRLSVLYAKCTRLRCKVPCA